MTIFYLITIVTIMVSSCKKVEETFTLTVSITKAGINDGEMAYFKLEEENDSKAMKAVSTYDATFSSGKATFTENEMKPGSYKLSAFIDVNRNASGTHSSYPDTGDYATEFSIKVDKDMQLEIKEENWVVYE